MNLLAISNNIEEREFGIFHAKTRSKVSYPEEGNQILLEIEDNSFWFDHRNALITSIIKKYSPNDRIFDIGGGNGFVSRALQEVGFEVILVEPGLEGALNARRRNVKYVICSTLENAGFRTNSLQSVGLFDIVEHLDDDLQFLQKVNSYMGKGHFLYLTVPAYKFLWSADDVEAGHFRRYSLKEICSLIEKCNFSIKYSSYIFSALPVPIFLFRSIPTRLGFIKKAKDLSHHKKDHQNPSGFMNILLKKIWSWEKSRVDSSRKIMFGSSCLVVAQK